MAEQLIEETLGTVQGDESSHSGQAVNSGHFQESYRVETRPLWVRLAARVDGHLKNMGVRG